MKEKTSKLAARIGATGLIALLAIFSGCETDDLLGVNPTVRALEGDWTCDEDSELLKKSTLDVYAVYLSPDADNKNGVLIDNFYGLGFGVSAKATVSLTSITLPVQELLGGFTVSGSGTISNNNSQIEWSYTVDDGSGIIDHVTAVYTKD